MITCQACGTANPPDAAYCSKCARKLDPETQQRVVEQRAQHTATSLNWTAVSVAAGVVIVVVIVVALLVTGVI
jgi:uncharacterized membrane protein YvbJ